MTIALWFVFAAHAVPATTSTTGCGSLELVGQLPAAGATVGTDVVPMLVYRGDCSLRGPYWLDDGTDSPRYGEAWSDHRVDDHAIVRFIGLPWIASDTAYTLTYEPEGFDPVELVFQSGAGPEGDGAAPEGPGLSMVVDSVVPSGRRELAVFVTLTVQAPEGVLVTLSDDEVSYPRDLFVSDGAPRVVEMGTTVAESQPVACFYAMVEDAYGRDSSWTEVCEEVALDEEVDDDDRVAYTPKKCSTVSAAGSWGLLAGLVLAVGRRRR